MRDHIERYTAKLISDRSADPARIAFAAQDDIMITGGDPHLSSLASNILARLNCLALCVARPSLPFAEYLLRRTSPDVREIIPRDTETRTFLHDIPVLRKEEMGEDPAPLVAALLGERKGVIAEGVGIIATGALTVEQAYINWSSVFHSTFVKYLEDVLDEGFSVNGEEEDFEKFRSNWLVPLTCDGLGFRRGPIGSREEILDEICRVGRYTVERGLVDSFFGNISYRQEHLIFISQTASSLDALEGCIDPVPFENTSTVGITASSELVAHRRIFEETGCRAILHGHPRFAVIMSMRCEIREGCSVRDCWKECPHVRHIDRSPVVAGEIGAGGLAKRVPPVIGQTGDAIVYGHGVFAIGTDDFADAFRRLVEVENICREKYFSVFDALMCSRERL